MAYVEFCCRSGGSNMNGGALASNLEPATGAAYSATNGAITAGNPYVFTPTSGNPSLSVNVGDFANVFPDAAPTTPVFVGRVTAVSSTTISISNTAKSGTIPGAAGTGISINVGGAWAGPSGTTLFPVAFLDGSTTVDAAGNKPRVNLKNDQTYSVTVSLAQNKSGPTKWQGYTTTFADGGRATIDGGTSGASYILWNINNAGPHLHEDIIFQNNGATGSASLVATTTAGNAVASFRRCVFAHSRGHGLDFSQSGLNFAVECEASDCNQNNTANLGGFSVQSQATLIRCYSHDHAAGANAHGFILNQGQARFCIADTCGGSGFLISSNSEGYHLLNCDSYNNTGDGFKDSIVGGNATFYFENCNAFKNGGWGINALANGVSGFGYIVNCAFANNTSGPIQTPSSGRPLEIIGQVNYSSGTTPWNAPATGDFTVTAAGRSAGRGAFLETQNSKSGTVSSIDIGSAQHADAGGSSGPVAQLKIFGRGAPY